MTDTIKGLVTELLGVAQKCDFPGVANRLMTLLTAAAFQFEQNKHYTPQENAEAQAFWVLQACGLGRRNLSLSKEEFPGISQKAFECSAVVMAAATKMYGSVEMRTVARGVCKKLVEACNAFIDRPISPMLLLPSPDHPPPQRPRMQAPAERKLRLVTQDGT
jgi:hypothetical protein